MTNVPCLYHTHECEFGTIAPGGFRILSALDLATDAIGHDLTITAGTNDHSIGKHPIGEALDVRVRDLTAPLIVKLREWLQLYLGPRFTVLFETPTHPDDPALAAIATINTGASAPHIHIQVKKGTSYPPRAVDEGTLKA